MTKIFIAILSLLMAVPAWIVLGWVIGYVKLSNLLPWPYSSYLYSGSFGFLSVMFYTILMRLALKKEEPKGIKPVRFSTWITKLVTGVVSVFLAGIIWIGLVFIMAKLKLPFSLVFMFSQFGVIGWILFGILSIIIYVLIIKMCRV